MAITAKTIATSPVSERLLTITIDQIRQYGAKRVTVVSVAEAAGMTHANVYRYHASKQALFDAVTTSWLKRLEDQVRNISDAPDPAADKLERIITSITRAYREKAAGDPEVFGLFLTGCAASRPVAKRHRLRLKDLLGRVIDEGVSAAAFQLPRRPALLLILDGAHRFLTPSAIRADLEQPWVEMERRLEQVMQALIIMLRRG